MYALVGSLALLAVVPDFKDAIQPSLNDVSFQMVVKQGKRSELRKISNDFAAGYEADKVDIYYKDSMKIRLNSYINGEKYTYIVNQGMKSYHVPRLGIKRTGEDVRTSPGKNQTLLDFGLISQGMADDFLKGTYVRTDQEGQYIYDVRFQVEQDKTRFRVWIDPAKRALTKKMWYGQDGKLKATFHYEGHKQVSGVWFPTSLRIINGEGKHAGTSSFQNIKVNTGLAESLFKL